MSFNTDSFSQTPAALLSQDRRADFIMRTYTYLLGAILGFTAIEIYLFTSGLAEPIARTLLGGSWLLVLGAFMIIGWLASWTAARAESSMAQLAALAAYVVAEAIIFVPMLYIADSTAPGVIQSAASLTIAGFIGLTAIAWWTRKDFSFLNGVLMWGGIAALLLIAGSLLFGFHLGTWFSVAMIALAGGAILRDTDNVLHNYPEDRHVAAALSLFASVALLFWYVLRLLMALQRD
ncbi:MAG: Bax inhibitor-1 family protein [Chloroflexota bacterium]